MTGHLREIRELSCLKAGIINLIEELDKHKELKGIQDYLRDLIECVYDNTNDKNYRKQAVESFKTLGSDKE